MFPTGRLLINEEALSILLFGSIKKTKHSVTVNDGKEWMTETNLDTA